MQSGCRIKIASLHVCPELPFGFIRILHSQRWSSELLPSTSPSSGDGALWSISLSIGGQMNTKWCKLSGAALVAFATVRCGGSDAVFPGGTGVGGNNADAAIGSGGASNTGGTDEAGTGGAATGGSGGNSGGTGGSVDSGSNTASDAGDASTCPSDRPSSGATCTGADTCFYADGVCRCRPGGGGTRLWVCAGNGDAGNDTSCPASAPQNGSSCSEAGTGSVCRYSSDAGRTLRCFCTNFAGDTWACN